MTHNRIQDTKNRNKRSKAESAKKRHTGEHPSEKQTGEQTTPDDRNTGTSIKNSPAFRNDERNFDIVIDGVPYLVKCIPFLFNEELRFRVIINGDAEHLFTWDSEIKMLRAIDDDASDLPDRLEEAISDKLQSQLRTYLTK